MKSKKQKLLPHGTTESSRHGIRESGSTDAHGTGKSDVSNDEHYSEFNDMLVECKANEMDNL
jgi:hypothetical protein